jgi:hypothetical protein
LTGLHHAHESMHDRSLWAVSLFASDFLK